MRILVSVLSVVSILSCLPGLSAAADPPTGFRDLRWGASQAEASAAFPGASCRDVPPTDKGSAFGDAKCFVYVKIGSAQAHLVLTFFNGLGFAAFSLIYKANDFGEIADSLTARYGEPDSKTQDDFVTRGGIRDVNTIMDWRWAEVEINARRFGGSIRDGITSVRTNACMAEVAKRRSAQKRDAGKDF